MKIKVVIRQKTKTHQLRPIWTGECNNRNSKINRDIGRIN